MAMTLNQKEEISDLLRREIQCKNSDISYGSRKKEFFLFRRTVEGCFRQLCLKERSVLIVYYGDEYEAMRNWASDFLPQALKSHPIFKGWQLEIGTSRPQGDRAVGCRLRNDSLASNAGGWYCNREAVTSAAVELFGILDKAGYFGDL